MASALAQIQAHLPSSTQIRGYPEGLNGYHRHRPEETALYKVLSKNYYTWLDKYRSESNKDLPKHVKTAFESYLECGILAHGFLRLKCTCSTCKRERIVAFSCQRHGFCPSCGGRFMNETAAILVDDVIPVQDVRQWVLSFPFPLRIWMSKNKKLCSNVLSVVISEINKYYTNKANIPEDSKKTATTAAVALIQYFGSALNLHTHFHILFNDGVFSNPEDPTFNDCRAPEIAEMTVVLEKIIKRVDKIVRKINDPNNESESEIIGRQFQKVGSCDDHRTDRAPGLCVNISGYSLHADLYIPAHRRDKLETVCRYILRPPVSTERLEYDEEKQRITYRLKNRWSDGTRAIVFEPLKFVQALSHLVPQPYVHIIRYFSGLAPNSHYRQKIIPKKETYPTEETKEKKNKKKRIPWAALLKRVFRVDIETCDLCGSKMKIIAALTERTAIKKYLLCIGEKPDPPIITKPLVFAIDQF